MLIFPLIVYTLCFATSLLCACLLVRSYRLSRTLLLLWSALCFACLALSNSILVADLVIFPNLDLSVARSALTTVGITALVFGQIWSSE